MLSLRKRYAMLWRLSCEVFRSYQVHDLVLMSMWRTNRGVIRTPLPRQYFDRMARKGRKKPVTSAYQRFIKEALAKLKKDFPNMEHRERFQRASQQWNSRLHTAQTSNRAPRDRGSH